MKERGQQAERLLNDPLLNETLDLIEQSLIQIWQASKEAAAREDVWYTLRGHQRFKESLKIAMETGKFEQALEEKLNG